MSSSIKEEIELLKTQITNEIDSFRYYKELSYVCASLLKQIDDYSYDENDECSLKKYRAYLQVFLELRIGYINKLIAEKINGSVFDNRDKATHDQVNEIEKEIEVLLDYIAENFPLLDKEVREEYYEIKNQYADLLDYTKNSSHRRFDLNIKLKGDKTDYIAKLKPDYKEEATTDADPVLAIYTDTADATRSYINCLYAFKKSSVDNLKVFVDNDKKVKEIFKKAYENLTNPVVINAIKQMEQNYIDKVNECMEKGHTFASDSLMKVQESMIKNGLQLDEIVEREKEKTEMHDMIFNVTVGFDNPFEINKLKEYVIKNDFHKTDFYRLLFFLIEREKYEKKRFDSEPKIYNSLDENTKLFLQKLFLSRLSLFGEEESERVIVDLKKNGYMNVVDRGYEGLFNSLSSKDKTFYSLGKEIPMEEPEFVCDLDTYVTPPLLHICKDGETLYKIRLAKYISGGHDRLQKIGRYYKYTFIGSTGKGERNYYLYFNKYGGRVKEFSDGEDLKFNSGSFYFYYNERLDSYYVTNRDLPFFKVISKIESNIIDYKKDLLVVINEHKKLVIRNASTWDYIEDYPVSGLGITIDGVDNTDVYLDSKRTIMSDGIIPFFVKSTQEGKCKDSICYYDLAAKKSLFSFKPKRSSESIYGYGEGLINFTNEQGSEGYVNKAGEVVIEPNFIWTYPFHGGFAYVKTNNGVVGFINHKGAFTPADSLCGTDKYKIEENQEMNRYELVDYKKQKRFVITASDGVRIDGPDIIIETLNNNSYLQIPILSELEPNDDLKPKM